MRKYKDFIEGLKNEFIGKKVFYKGEIFNIVMVDYNGIIHIDKPGKFTDTTAVYEAYEARKNLI